MILSQTIQATEEPRAVLEHLLRIGGAPSISLPNFGYWRVRLSLLVGGRMPRTQALGLFAGTTRPTSISAPSPISSVWRGNRTAMIERALALDGKGRTRPMRSDAWGPNLFAEGAIFLLRQR